MDFFVFNTVSIFCYDMRMKFWYIRDVQLQLNVMSLFKWNLNLQFDCFIEGFILILSVNVSNFMKEYLMEAGSFEYTPRE